MKMKEAKPLAGNCAEYIRNHVMGGLPDLVEDLPLSPWKAYLGPVVRWSLLSNREAEWEAFHCLDLPVIVI